jgi:hypothetical protein
MSGISQVSVCQFGRERGEDQEPAAPAGFPDSLFDALEERVVAHQPPVPRRTRPVALVSALADDEPRRRDRPEMHRPVAADQREVDAAVAGLDADHETISLDTDGSTRARPVRSNGPRIRNSMHPFSIGPLLRPWQCRLRRPGSHVQKARANRSQSEEF